MKCTVRFFVTAVFFFFKGLTSDIHLSIWKCVVPDHASDDKDSFKIDSHSFICLRL